MTNQMIRKIIQDLESLPESIWVSVNIVSSHLETGSLTKLLADLNWPCANRIHFELTERIPVKDVEAAKKRFSTSPTKVTSSKLMTLELGMVAFLICRTWVFAA